jgi:hypothetical protein
MPLSTRFRESEEEFDTRVPSLEVTRSIVRERSVSYANLKSSNSSDLVEVAKSKGWRL